MIYTIGHSTHPIEVFIALLQAHGILQLADVRTIPASRRHPQFGQARLSASLQQHGILYRHIVALGGLRRPPAHSVNTGLRNGSYRGYADHMQSGEFLDALDQLIGFSRVAPTVIMCAELRYVECHRQLLADALLVRDVPVLHIVPGAQAKPHTLSGFARVQGRKVTYPGLV